MLQPIPSPPAVKPTPVMKCVGSIFYLPREVFLPMGLGMRPFPKPDGLVLFPENRFCVGDVGERSGSAVLGLAERFSGCVDPSSCWFEYFHNSSQWQNVREKAKLTSVFVCMAVIRGPVVNFVSPVYCSNPVEFLTTTNAVKCF